MPFDPNFNFNFVDIRDVANTMIVASEKGKNSERYILAREHPISSTEVLNFAHSLYPTTKIPPKLPYTLMYILASIMECISKIAKKRLLMLRSQVKEMYKTDYRYNNSKAKKELDFNPRPQRESLKEAFEYIVNKDKK